MTDLDVHLQAIQSADAGAFADWLVSAEPPLRESLRRFAAYVDTEATLQEALLRVWQVAPRHKSDGRPNSLLRLAVRIARNLALDEVRRARRDVRDPSVLDDAPDGGDDPRACEPDPHLRRAIVECRESIRGKPGDALSLRLDQGGASSDEELAAQLGMRLNTFLQNFTRARKLLLTCLERHGIDLSMELR
jgi:RNA polymerase sigma-70 factor (ECF subfamily)